MGKGAWKKMTNAEKYLKDGVDLCELIRNIADYKPKLETSDNVYAKMQEFFYEQAKPTLTEDERAILRNLPKEYKFIHRVRNKRWLELSSDENDNGHLAPFAYDHLFQFIKERRRISDSRTFERRIENVS